VRAGDAQQNAAKGDNVFVASTSEILPPPAAFCHRQLPEFAAGAAQVYRILTFICSLPQFSADDLFCPLMTDSAQRKRGGRAFHSILEPHLDFIRQQRQRRKTWQEIADLLCSEKDIRVTLYAPYHFYRRRLKRAAHWENSAADSQPAHPSAATSQPQLRPAPLPMKPDFKRPNLSSLNTEEFT
jgi:hypothetical protein